MGERRPRRQAVVRSGVQRGRWGGRAGAGDRGDGERGAFAVAVEAGVAIPPPFSRLLSFSAAGFALRSPSGGPSLQEAGGGERGVGIRKGDKRQSKTSYPGHARQAVAAMHRAPSPPPHSRRPPSAPHPLRLHPNNVETKWEPRRPHTCRMLGEGVSGSSTGVVPRLNRFSTSI